MRALAAQTGKLPHEILLAIARGDDANVGIPPTPEMRIDCATAAAPDFAARLAAALVKHTGDDLFEDWSAREIQDAIAQVKAAVERAKGQQARG